MIGFFIRRRVTTAMLFSGVCLLGAISLKRLPVRLLPDIEHPCLTIVTAYENAPPSEIEKLVTRRVEEAVGSVSGVKEIKSESIEGLSVVTARFDWGRDMNLALIETREKVDIIRGQLPQESERSVVMKYDPSEEPVMVYSITCPEASFRGLRRRVEKEIVPLIERTEGVSMARLNGGYTRQICVELDCAAMHSRGVSLADVVGRIGLENASFPSGSIERGDVEYAVRTAGEFENPAEIGALAVARSISGLPVYLGSIAEVTDGFRDMKCAVSTGGKEAVSLMVHREPGRNTIETCEAAGRTMSDVARRAGGVTCEIIYDASVFIRQSVTGVSQSAIAGGLIAFAVLVLFLGSVRPALIISTSIPVSMLGTFALMRFSGLSLNVMSMGGLALGAGMMVDAGIVVLEAVSVSSSPAASGAEAAIIGAEEVKRSVAASVATSLVVFLPVLFLPGIAGALFRELALTISFSLACSLVTSLTLIPMLASLPAGGAPQSPALANAHARLEALSATLAASMRETSRRVLEYAIGNSRFVLGAGIACAIAGLAVTMALPREIMPPVDRGEFTVRLTAPGGTPLAETISLCRSAESVLRAHPCVDRVHSVAGCDPLDGVAEKMSGRAANVCEIRATLKERRSSGVERIMSQVRHSIATPAGVRAEVFARSDVIESVLSSGESPLTVEISGEDVKVLKEIGERIEDKARRMPGVCNVRSLLCSANPELRVMVDRTAMSSLGVSVASASSAIRAAVRGEVATEYRDGDDDIDVRVRLRPGDLSSASSLGSVPVAAGEGGIIPLGRFASIQEGEGFSRIVRSRARRVNIVSGDIDGDRGNVFRRMETQLASMPVPEGYAVSLRGQYSELSGTIPGMIFTIALAVVLVYMVLASQFQSFSLPLIIMCTIPLTLTGSSGALMITGQSLNINSGIGMVLLVGTVVNNAIVLVDRVLASRAAGLGAREALIEAGTRRVRPIIMTTATTVFAMIPVALGIGSGAEIQRPLAVTVTGGLLVSTALTLVVIPALYAVLYAGSDTRRSGERQ